jgi:hypothetical protein
MIELDRVIAPDAEIVSELITSDPYPRRYLRFDHTVPPDQRRKEHFTTSGILGWAVAAAIGVKIGKPGEVWCLTGDGCFSFGGEALWSQRATSADRCVDLQPRVPANRVNANAYGGRIPGKSTGCVDPDIDPCTWRAYGIGATVSAPGEIAPALARCKPAAEDGLRGGRHCPPVRSGFHVPDFFSVARTRVDHPMPGRRISGCSNHNGCRRARMS